MIKTLLPILSLCLIASFVFAACSTPSTPVATNIPPEKQPTEASEPASEEIPTEAPSEEPAIYQDPAVDIDSRVEDLLGQMTLEEKIGQMTQVEKGSINEKDITTRFIGSILSGGGGSPDSNTAEAWAEMVNGFQERALETRLGIPLIYGVDAVHGHANLKGATVFPQNIGMGATRDADLAARVARATALEMAATGIYWNFGPVMAVTQDIRWGRTYEGYGENTELVSELSSAYLQGLQNLDGTIALSDSTTI
ncbi:MAG: glycoside hydrolase family 3 N-terminal domain-containing protein, partial [Chloroflexota bacterium]|nr:glycoside hydrolase family 3 N-terminal domain-containing protein [Chloroflexota bacterium]